MPPLRIFFTGATGYIGGSILTRILKHPKINDFEITVLVRSESKAKGFESFGLKVVIGTLDDLDILERLAYESDIVIQSAVADHISGTKAILKGLKKKFDETGVATPYIHTSGTGALIDDAEGEYAGGIIYSDLDVEAIESIPLSKPHRPVDTTLVVADQEGYTKAYIVLPSQIWGVASNAFDELDLQRRVSIIIPFLIDVGAKRGKAAICGKGLNMWPHINIEEMGEFYYALFDEIISGKEPSHGREGYYFIEGGEYTLYQVCEAIGKELYEAGKIDSPTPVDLNSEERAAFPWIKALGGNSRARGERARSLPWKPTKTTEDLIESLKPEVAYYLNRPGQ